MASIGSLPGCRSYLPFHRRDQRLLEPGFDGLCQSERFPVVRERVLRAAAGIQRFAQGCVDAGRIGRQSLSLLCFFQGIRKLVSRQQQARFLHVTQRGSEWNVEVSIVYKDAIVDDRDGFELLELFVGIQRAGPKLKAGQHTGAHKYRAIDCRRHIVRAIEVKRIGRNQRLAGYAVIAEVRDSLTEVGKPAILDACSSV